MQIEWTTIKNSCPEESKIKEFKTTLFWVQTNNFFKQAYKEKKKKKYKEKRDKKNRPRLAPQMLIKSKKRKRKTAIVISVKSCAIIITKKATMQIFTPNQKTSVGFDNLCANDWWW